MKELKKREGREKAGEVEWSERVEGGKGREEEVKRKRRRGDGRILFSSILSTTSLPPAEVHTGGTHTGYGH